MALGASGPAAKLAAETLATPGVPLSKSSVLASVTGLVELIRGSPAAIRTLPFDNSVAV